MLAISASLATNLLLFSSDFVLIPLVVIGLIWGRPHLFFRALSLLFSSMPINFLLKSFFKVPLLPSIGKAGFAFPSGHMQSCAVFYGLLFLQSSSKGIRVLLAALIPLIGWALVHQGYHTPIDIFGALVAAFGILFVETQLIKAPLRTYTLAVLALNSSLLLQIGLQGPLPHHLVQFATIHFAFLCTNYVLNFPQSPKAITPKITLTILSFSVIFLSKTGLVANSDSSILPWAIVGAIVPIGQYLCALWLQPRSGSPKLEKVSSFLKAEPS